VTVITLWHNIGGTLERAGRPDPRPGLIYGQYEPEAAAIHGTNGVTAGLLNVNLLTDYNASSVQTVTLTDGQTISNKQIYGDIRLPSTHNTDITLTNCYLRGGPHIPTTTDAVVKADNGRSGTGRLIMVDCEIDPQLPSLNRDGIRGNRLEIYRCWIHDVIDGFAPYALTSQNSGNAYAYMYGCVIEELIYFYPDYINGTSGGAWHTDGSHNDGIAISGGKNILIKGNLIRGTGYAAPGNDFLNSSHPGLGGTGFTQGQGILISDSVGNPLDNTVIVEENYFYGAVHNVMINPNQTCLLRNNKHYRAVYVGASSLGYWIRCHQRAGNGVTVENSTWIDGPYEGQVLIEPRDLGIDFIA
jgi:hypothetical protein